MRSTMKLKQLTEALNHYYLKKFPNAKGWFIGKEMMEPTKLNLYKKYKAEIFYHTQGKNSIAFTVQLIERCPEGSEEIIKERALECLLEEMFTNLSTLDKYEAV